MPTIAENAFNGCESLRYIRIVNNNSFEYRVNIHINAFANTLMNNQNRYISNRIRRGRETEDGQDLYQHRIASGGSLVFE